jgi:hypothetical protein
MISAHSFCLHIVSDSVGGACIEGRLPGDAAELRRLASLHYRYRFDPRGLSGTERSELAQRASAWMKDVGLHSHAR